MKPNYHTPVMLNECLDALCIKKDGIYVDLTFGGGGHSRAILQLLGPDGKLFGFDQDLDSLSNAEATFDDNRLSFIRSNFRYLKNWMTYYGVTPDGILADLGVSSHHLDTVERGFSFRGDAPLDMRMNQKGALTAEKVLNEYPEEKIVDVLRLYGEVKDAKRVARAICSNRSEARIATTGLLVDVVAKVLPRDREKKELAKVFQALRIEVNGEMQVLKEMLSAAAEVLPVGGRLVVMTYHSLEDRLVKNMIKCGNTEGKVEQDIFGRTFSPFKSIGKGVIVPSAAEQESNPRSRSAKLRVAEKVEAHD